jgi:hypothetical protein
MNRLIVTKGCYKDVILPENIKQEQILILSIAGSNMYGLATPESDKDYLGIYIPTREQLFLNNFPKQASLPKESGLDLQIWSIHYFLNLACQGETMAIDLLHSPYSCWCVYEAEIWEDLRSKKNQFYTKGMKAFVSYARKQAAKYGIKGKRIETLETVISYLNECMTLDPDGILKDHWNDLPDIDHVHFLEPDRSPFKMYQVCGKKFQETVKLTYIKEHLQKSLTEYGERAMLAKENKGVDWKAVSHAYRTAEQVYDILKFGEYKYPLKNAAFIRNIKLGKLDFTTVVQPALEEAMDDVEELIDKSDLPETVDKKFWDYWLINLLETYIL